MRGPITMLAVFAALCALATATRRLLLSGVKPVADERAPQSMWLFDAALVVRSLENLTRPSLAAMVLIAPMLWMRTA